MDVPEDHRPPPAPGERGRILAAALDGAPAFVFVADAQMRYVAVNRYACDLLGYTEKELRRMRVTDVATYDTAAADYEGMIEAGYGVGVARLRCKDGSVIAMRYVAGEADVGGETLYVAVGWY